MHTRKIDVNNVTLACLLSETENKPVLMFLHGASSTNEVWRDQWLYFKDRTKVIIPDLPGHGDSSGNSCDSVEAYADTVIRLAQRLHPGRFVLAGHSMGGAIAQRIAVMHPELLAGLVLVATGARLKVMPQVFSAIETNYDQYIELATSFSMAETADEQKKHLFREVLYRSSPKTAYDDFSACNKFDVMNAIEGIKIKTLIIAGNKDVTTPLKYSQYLNQKITDSRLEIIDGAGHMVMMEKPDQVNKAIEGFVSAIR